MRRHRLAKIFGMIGLLGLVVCALFDERKLVTHSSNFYYSSKRVVASSGGLAYMLQLFSQYETTDTFRRSVLDRIPREEKLAWLLESLTQIRLRLITQRGIPHRPPGIADFVAGVGWCDQVNAVAARALASYYDHAEVYALRYEDGNSPHSIGRVFDHGSKDWTYFDIWGDFVVIFRKSLGKPLELLASRKVIHTGMAGDEVEEGLLRLYNETVDLGGTLTEVKAGFPQQLMSKVIDKVIVRRSSNESLSPKEDLENTPLMCAVEPPVAKDFFVEERLSLNKIIPDDELGWLYFQARIDLLAGLYDSARSRFLDLQEKVLKDSSLPRETREVLEINLSRLDALSELSRIEFPD